MNHSNSYCLTLLVLVMSISQFFLCGLSSAGDWKQWRGPERNGLSSEKNLVDGWPKEGPREIWKSKEKTPLCDKAGYSSLVVADGRVFLFHTEKGGQDRVLCFDANNGETLWKYSFPGAVIRHSISSSPCIYEGYCYGIGTAGTVYCIDVKTGGNAWEGKPNSAPTNSSFLIEDGIAFLGTNPFTAFDAKTGDVIWTKEKIVRSNASPVLWRKDGKTYVICMDNISAKPNILSGQRGTIYCLEPKTGNILWEHKGSTDSTPVVSGDYLVTWGFSLRAYKMSLTGLVKHWDFPGGGISGTSPTVYKGRVYALGRKISRCVDLASGKMLSEATKGTPVKTEFCSPIIADSKMFTTNDKTLRIHSIVPEDNFKILAAKHLNLNGAASPALSNGKMYLRLRETVACYELSKKKAQVDQK